MEMEQLTERQQLVEKEKALRKTKEDNIERDLGGKEKEVDRSMIAFLTREKRENTLKSQLAPRNIDVQSRLGTLHEQYTSILAPLRQRLEVRPRRTAELRG